MKELLEKRYRLTLVWNYEEEEQWINELSEQGLHLKQAGTVKCMFKRDTSVRYSYCLDYQPGLSRSDGMQEYLDLYQDAGWEYVTSYKGIWHYFRREWQPDTVQRLYTDRESLAGQYKKIQRVLGWLFILNVVIFFAMMMNLLFRLHGMLWLWGVIIPVSVLYLILFVLLGYGYLKTGKKIRKYIE
ncbi:DUF2812 domain-containing protein [Paenibacillus donghaensis]|uniref:DUF2812 domain-containing protein n=1 Tax=Paenibacillus donghaensis TaxID=414771 RepID=UPI001883E998|nr:DUF2812 domain-containing protein [Paenibacillus donghaensis]MBE9913963.1 DUF2812 domain-containing protein [Paenibacillus donghaensis]